jgi:hypothetical protein
MTVIDFPDTPTPGQEFTVGAMTWVFNDPLWNLKLSGSGGGGGGGPDTLGFTFTQDTPPTTTRIGDTWFDTAEGRSFIWFDDRWVQFSPGGGGGGATAPGLVVTPWTQIPLAAAWMNYDAAHPAQIRKVGDNVEIRGLIKAAIPSAVGSAINSAALGPEFLPAQADETFVQGGDRVVGLVTVFKATGLIVPAAPLTDAYIYLSGIRYSTVA